jgi:lysophospholipase L1-like esterase
MTWPRIIGLALLLTGCAADVDDGDDRLTPSRGSSTGYYPVQIELNGTGLSADVITAVTVGGIRAFALTATADGLQVIVQGHGTPGPTEVVLHTESETRSLDQFFMYEAPGDARFATMMAFGASLTQGVQAGVPSQRGALHSPAMYVARQLGAYLPTPLLLASLFPGLGPQHVGAPPACLLPNVGQEVAKQSIQVLSKLKDANTGKLSYAIARVDPDLDIANVAVGGSSLHDVLHGPDASNIGVSFVSHLVYDPYGPFLGPVTGSQIGLLEAGKPTILMSSDLLGNDIIGGLVLADTPDPSKLTPFDKLQADLEVLLKRLAATGAAVFIANVPRPTILPASATQRSRLIERARARAKPAERALAAQKAAEQADKDLAVFDAYAVKANASLTEQAARYDNVHVVDLHAEVQAREATGVEAGANLLTLAKFGGLLGIDGVHFSDTGYALVANLFIDAINTKMTTAVPHVDIAEVHAKDPESPAAFKAAGLDVDACSSDP